MASRKHKNMIGWGGSYEPPLPEGVYVLESTKAANNAVGATLVGKGEQYPSKTERMLLEKKFDQVDEDYRNFVLWLGYQILGMSKLTFENINSTNDEDYKTYVTLMPDVDSVGNYKLTVYHPDIETLRNTFGISDAVASTLAAGSNATASVNDGVLYLGIPRGDTGAQGATGQTGAQGATGATGAQGAQGAKGDKGDKGDTGEPGIDGADGVNGKSVKLRISGGYIQWAQFVEGSDDPFYPGWQNLIAVAELVGATGATGATGAKGDTGEPGQDGTNCNCDTVDLTEFAVDFANTDDKRCFAATAFVGLVADVYTRSVAELNSPGGWTGDLAQLLTGAFVGLISGGASTAFNIATYVITHGGAASFVDGFTTEMQAQLLCIVYGVVDENGALTQDDLNLVKSDVDALLSSSGALAWALIGYIIASSNVQNFDNALAAYPPTVLDCEDCVVPDTLMVRFFGGFGAEDINFTRAIQNLTTPYNETEDTVEDLQVGGFLQVFFGYEFEEPVTVKRVKVRYSVVDITGVTLSIAWGTTNVVAIEDERDHQDIDVTGEIVNNLYDTGDVEVSASIVSILMYIPTNHAAGCISVDYFEIDYIQ